MIKEEINKIFDNCYTKGVGHTIFQRQKALNEIISYLKRERIVKLKDKTFPTLQIHGVIIGPEELEALLPNFKAVEEL